MGKLKKKMAVGSESKESSVVEAAPAQPRKRGRPRKVVQEEKKVNKEDERDAEEQTTPVLQEEDSKKKQRASPNEGSAVDSSSTIKAEQESGQNGSKTIKTEELKVGAGRQQKREGNRRKSEPRRAAESLIQGR